MKAIARVVGGLLQNCTASTPGGKERQQQGHKRQPSILEAKDVPLKVSIECRRGSHVEFRAGPSRKRARMQYSSPGKVGKVVKQREKRGQGGHKVGVHNNRISLEGG